MKPEELKSLMEERVGIPIESLTPALLREAGCMERVAVLPENYNDRIRYLGNLLVQMITSAKCDDRLKSRVGHLSQSMSYLLNSQSWSDGKLYDFDSDELKRKLRHFI